MTNDRRILCCFRIADVPTPLMPSVIRKCSKCTLPIYVSTGVCLQASKDADVDLMCLRCVDALVRTDKEPPVVELLPGQAEEAALWSEDDE